MQTPAPQAPSPPTDARVHAGRAALLFLGALLLLLWGLGNNTLWSRDETTYADIARQMLRDGDWLTLHWNGRPWLNHPPLFYWLMVVDFRVFGISEWAARLPAAVFGAAGVSLAYLWCVALGRPRGAVVAALALLLNVQYFLESRMAIIDSTFLFFISLTLFGFWLGWQGMQRGWLLFFSACGLSCLAKGPWGVVFAFGVGVPFVMLGENRSRLAAVPWGWGLSLTALIGGSWYVAGALRHGEGFVRTVLGYYFLGRMTTQVEHQGGPIWLYVPVLLAGFLPWSFLLLPALRTLWTQWRNHEGSRLILCWIVVPFIGLSLASTKLPSYAGFLLPPCAIAVGVWVDGLRERRPLALPLALAAAFSLSLAAAVGWWGSTWVDISQEAFAAAQHAFFILAVGLAMGAGAAWLPRAPLAPLSLAAAGSLLFLLTVSLGFVPALEPSRSLQAAARVLQVAAPRETPKAFYGPGVFGLIFYGDDGPIDELVDEAALRAWLDSTPGGVLLLRRDTFARLAPEVVLHLVPLAGTEREMVVRVRPQ